MLKYRIGSAVLILSLALLGYFIFYAKEKLPFRFGLDLVGGTELVYRAEVSEIASQDIGSSMDTLRDVIERRVNIFGVSEPIVQVEKAGLLSGNPDHRLIVELPGYKDVEEAKRALGETPLLEFRLEKPETFERLENEEIATTSLETLFAPSGITGRLLRRSSLQFDQNTGKPLVALEFNSEGKEILARVTRDNVGKVLGIFLDHVLLQTPVIKEEIRDGSAVITGYDAKTGREIVRQLNFGALPVPIELSSTQSIGATLGEAALRAGLSAGVIGFLLVAAFLILWYRLPGIVSVVALTLYVLISLSLFRLIPVTLTAAGVAGFILSIGMAVDANILIFERTKEELRGGKKLADAMREGFHRAWLSIRDSNISSIITAVVLFWLGTSAVKGFALTLGIGVLVSMFTAITASRTFLFALSFKSESSLIRFLFGSGLR
ncbi:protein translocase subunit SecD [Patescibacteria group bacterium]|nr:MAG: protein translocase subunit SecD [Patescibacteria group bacterium]